jgi:DDE superfamily endonuclease
MSKAIVRDPIYRGRRFQPEIIELCVRWYLTYRLSYRDLVEMMAERGVVISHSTILRWVQRYVPEFERRWSRYARGVNSSLDETAVSVRGGTRYLYRAVDKYGKTFDSLLCTDRSELSAIRFHAYNPLAGGAFSRNFADSAAVAAGSRFDSSTAQGKLYRDRYMNDAYLDALAEIHRSCEGHGDRPRRDVCPRHGKGRDVLSDGLLNGKRKWRTGLRACMRMTCSLNLLE